MLNRAEIVQKLQTLMETEFLADESLSLDASTPLLRLGILDSFALLRLTVCLEKEFDISIPLETLSLEQFKDLNSIAELVEQKLA